MSYNPNTNYGYPTAPNYYVEDPEEFLHDYTDSEVLSEHQQQLLQTAHPNVTEIYSRNEQHMIPQKTHMVATQAGYYQNQAQYLQQLQHCYYENPAPQATTRLTAVPLQDYAQSYDPRLHQYCPLTTSSLHDTNYDTAAYRSAQHATAAPAAHQNMVRGYQEAVQRTQVQKHQNFKRHPIKVGTPKYYRKPPSNAVCKRPSALCLPVASQPDPAVHRKHKKQASETQYGLPQNPSLANNSTNPPLLSKPSQQVMNDHKVDSEGDFNVTVKNLEDMFSNIENGVDVTAVKSKSDLVKFAKLLKPRVPPSIKTKQDTESAKIGKTNANEKISDTGKSDTRNEDESPSDSIERLLNQLKKCEQAVSMDVMEKGIEKGVDYNSKSNTEKVDQEKNQAPPGRPKSFNYQDITSKMTKSQCEMKAFERDQEQSSSGHDLTRQLNVSMSTSRSFVSRPQLDDHCALELHRSKSYIVNLIDRALSKELGTVPSNRTQREYNDMSPRKAIDMMNRHSCGGKSDKELCFEITSALTDSIISNATAPIATNVIHPLPSSASSSKGKVCCCNSEEPTYIKQLKQLRWGHLKHIQREVRRLEDLERFLDSCSLNPISEM